MADLEIIAAEGGLKVEVAKDYESLSRAAARLVLSELKLKPDLLLCASAGGTPSRLYELLAEGGQRAKTRRLEVIQIDEWAGLPASHPGTCKVDLEQKLIRPLGLKNRAFFAINSAAPDLEIEAGRVRAWLRRKGPIDVCILGLGTNGHVAMNEPAAYLQPHAHVARLAKSSVKHPLLSKVRPKPSRGITLGMVDILASRKVILLVSGASKREALARLLDGRVSTQAPASLLWLHRDATILCDRAAR